ncbi:MAG: hypothetical protein JXK05_08530 [Campylobacterales bacterium]|nr:hypothetical protein [Campylobacterales bacterium]
MGRKSIDKQQAKEMQKAINKLQKELGEEIVAIFKEAGKPLDVEELMERYPDNARRQESNATTLKRYMQLGLGPLVQEGVLKQLPQSADGRYRLELA